MTNSAEMFSLAWKHHQAGEFSQAEKIFRQIVNDDPGHAESWCLLGMLSHKRRDFGEAEANFRRTLQIWPNHHVAQNGLAIIQAETGRLDEAAAGFEQLCLSRPNDTDAHNNLGLVRARQGQLDEAIACYQRALSVRPQFDAARENLNRALAAKGAQTERMVANALQNHGSPALVRFEFQQRAQAFIAQGRWSEARDELLQLLHLDPNDAEASVNLAHMYVRLERFDQAIAQYKLALQLQPDHFGAHYILAIALHDKGRHEEAADHYRQAVRLNPNFADAQEGLGVSLMALGRVDEAVACYRQALRLNPDSLQALNNLGTALQKQGKPEEAMQCYERALQIDPQCVAACDNLGMTRQRQGELDDAMELYERALRLNPKYAPAHWNRAVVWLLRGDFERGWPEYEWRWEQADYGERHFLQPVWDGSPLEGRTILIYAEGGLGDTLQFVRYAPLVKERGGKVILQCQPALFKLLAGVSGIDILSAKGDPLSAFDTHAAIMSLPLIFHTRLDNMPARVPYLRPNAELVVKWQVLRGQEMASRERKRPEEDSFLVGIAWQGNPEYKSDRIRSIPLALFEPLARVPGVKLISLQKGYGVEQLRGESSGVSGQESQNGRTGIGFNVLDLGERLDADAGAFMDTSAILKHLDLVISSDSALAHLAGALGVPVWVALPLVPDWRWMLEREDSPWYPTMRLFRQKRPGEWGDVFSQIAEALREAVIEARAKTTS